MKSLRTLIAAIVVLSSAAVIVNGPSAQADNIDVFGAARIGSASGNCLDWGGGSQHVPQDEPVTLRACELGRRQDFTGGDSRVETSAWINGPTERDFHYMCLDVPALSVAVVVRTCSRAVTQDWIFLGSNTTFINKATGLCLQPAGGVLANGTRLEVGNCNGAAYQHWTAWTMWRYLDVPPAQRTPAGVHASIDFGLHADEALSNRAPYRWTATGLPPGLVIDSRVNAPDTTVTGIFGTPTTPGEYQVTARATDTRGDQLDVNFTWTVTAPLVQVPDVLGDKLTSANTQILAAGLNPVTGSPIATCDVSIGNVVSTNPSPGTSVAPGSSVELHLAKKPATPCN